MASLWRATWRRAISAVLAVVLFAGTTAMSINIDFGELPTVRSALGLGSYAGATLPEIARPDPATQPTIATWVAPPTCPPRASWARSPSRRPCPASRPGVVYLPPAALTAAPPRLPVLIMLSGQPGTPDAPLDAAKLQRSLDAYTAAHQGLAPIVVSPDHLGDPQSNPMCVDSPLGNSASYLTVDVPAWITTNLPVLEAPRTRQPSWRRTPRTPTHSPCSGWAATTSRSRPA